MSISVQPLTYDLQRRFQKCLKVHHSERVYKYVRFLIFFANLFSSSGKYRYGHILCSLYKAYIYLKMI